MEKNDAPTFQDDFDTGQFDTRPRPRLPMIAVALEQVQIGEHLRIIRDDITGQLYATKQRMTDPNTP